MNKGTFITAATVSLAALASPLSAKELPEVLPDPDGKEADMTKPVQVFILMGQSNMLGFGKVRGDKAGTLETATKAGKYPYLVDDKGAWTTRKDVRNVRVMMQDLHQRLDVSCQLRKNRTGNWHRLCRR